MGAKICGMVASREDDRSTSRGNADPLLCEYRCSHFEAANEDSVTRRSIGVDVQSFSENLCSVCSVCGHSRFRLSADDVGGKERENESSEPTVALPSQGASEPSVLEERPSVFDSIQNLQLALNAHRKANANNTRIQPAQTLNNATLHLQREADATVDGGSASKAARFESRRYRLAIPYRFAGEYRSQIVPPPNRTVFDAPDCMCDFSIVDHTAVPKNTSFCFLTKKRPGVKEHADRSCNGHTTTGESATKAAKFSHRSPDSPAYAFQGGLNNSARTNHQTNHVRVPGNAIEGSSQTSTQRLLKRWPLNFGGKSGSAEKF